MGKGVTVAFTTIRRSVGRRLSPGQQLSVYKFRHGLHGYQRWWRSAWALVTPDRLIGTEARDLSDILTSEQARDIVADTLARRGVQIRLLPSPVADGPRILAAAEDLPTLISALSYLPNVHAWAVRIRRRGRAKWLAAPRAVLKIGEGAAVISLRRTYELPTGKSTAFPGLGEVRIELWEALHGGEERADGEPHLPGTRVPRSASATVPYLTAELWDSLPYGPVAGTPALSLPHLMAVTEPVDVVYTWVDGSDPAWAQRKRVVLGTEGAADDVNASADSHSRFASHDELRYSLRSLEAYAPWVRHVYLVTDRQVPAWLVDNHPRLTVVDHSEIFTDPSVLPVFNSHAIESQLHHIDGLSERYLYVNDDVFFGRSVSVELFFEANGIAKFYLSKATLDVGPASARDLPVLSAAKRNADLIAQTFGRSITRKFKHTPHTQSRRVLDEMEERFPEVFAQVASSRIRHPDDHSIASALQHYYAYAMGHAIPGEIRYAYVNLSDAEAELALLRLLLGRNVDVFCLNDTFTDADGEERAHALSAWFLEEYFPLPSSFERPTPGGSVTGR